VLSHLPLAALSDASLSERAQFLLDRFGCLPNNELRNLGGRLERGRGRERKGERKGVKEKEGERAERRGMKEREG
jgi:hypothetical protein